MVAKPRKGLFLWLKFLGIQSVINTLMKPIPKVPGKIPRELNYDIIYGSCLKFQLRVIVFTHKDGFIVRVTDLEYKTSEDYYKWGENIKITMGILYRIKQELKQKYKDECRSSI